FISHKEYEGMEYDVSEYTMSEIISTIYDTMAESGIKEGILFLDEINCVSETLAPSMLQFLQYKVFGRHKVPEGWVIVTAGNPPEYNKSVRDFDVVTYDRLRVLEVEADYAAWKVYAQEKGIHPAILNFLELKKDYFYHMETTVKGRLYVTARGWEDLSEIIKLYEEEGITVDETLVGQYLRSDRIVKEFTAYYDLFNKYKKDYRVEEILAGQIPEHAVERAGSAPFDERLSLLGMLLDKVMSEIRENMEQGAYLSELVAPLKALQGKSMEETLGLLEKYMQTKEKQLYSQEKAGALSTADRKMHKRILQFYGEVQKELLRQAPAESFPVIKAEFEKCTGAMKKQTLRIKERLHALFVFVEAAFAEGNEMLILVTELTVNTKSAEFIARFGCEDYQRNNEKLMLSERQEEMQKSIAELAL
ncbi:MAG: ATPase, partial [Lachnospiraceae bacterium]